MAARDIFRHCLRCVLQLLLLCAVGLFFVYLSAISLNVWWMSRAQASLGRHLRFPYLSESVAKRFDKADKFFDFPLSEDLALAVSMPHFQPSVDNCARAAISVASSDILCPPDSVTGADVTEKATTQVWVFWGLTFVASLLVLALKALPTETPHKPIKHGRMPKWRIADAVSHC